MYDFIVIGSGVVGSAIARELSKYDVKIAVLEKNSDVCFETSGRNSGVVHGGFSYDTGSLKNLLCLKGNLMFDELSKELNFPFNRCGKLLVGNSLDDFNRLKLVMEQGKRNGVCGMEIIIGQDKISNVVPYAIGNYAILSKNSGIVDTFLFNIALAENAHFNGVDFYFNQQVNNIKVHDNFFEIFTDKTTYKTKWIINSAGLNAHNIAKLVGINDYKVIGSKGEYIIIDKKVGKLLPMPLYPVPSNTYMGIHLTNTVDGNILIGPNAETTEDFSDYSVRRSSINFLEKEAKKIYSNIDRTTYIRNYSGILPKWVDDNGIIQDFKIEISKKVSNFINLIGIESPGLTAAVPIGEYVCELIKNVSQLKENKNFSPNRKAFKRFLKMNFEEKSKAIKENPDYGEIICKCEMVSKAEILYAINNPLGVNSIKSIKYRTRAMTGSCQGGYCQTKIANLIEKNLNNSNVKFSNENTNIFTNLVREKYDL